MEIFFLPILNKLNLKFEKIPPSLPPGSKKTSKQQFQTNIILRIALQ